MQKIFIIHGWTYSLSAWDDCLALLREKGIDPVMLRVPGLTAPSSEVWTLDRYVAWLEESLKGETDIMLVGHSNGGRIAIAYAAKNPPALKKLMLIDAAGIVHNEKPLRMKRSAFGAIARAGKIFSGIPGIRRVYYRLIGANDYGRAPENMRATMSNLIAIDLTDRLSKISVPTFILWGKKDKATPVSDAHLMHEKIAGSRLAILPEAGHSPHKTHPRETDENLVAFAKS